MTGTRELTDSQRQWLRVREHLTRHRHSLAVQAFSDYGRPPLAGDAPLLMRPEWLPVEPLLLLGVELDYAPAAPFRGSVGDVAEASDVLPVRPDGTRYARYSDALTDLGSASLNNLPTYRLLGADLRTSPQLILSDGYYFDLLDTGEASAHEYAGVDLGEATAARLRAVIGDPTDFARRPTNVAISALTLRHDRRAGEVTMPLHRRGGNVGHAGGMIQVVPVGVFQPAGPQPWNVANDLSVWRLLLREYAEELLGRDEDYGTSSGPLDYAAWPFGARMTAALDDGRIRAYALGLGVDPLTFATDLLVAVVFDSATYDDLFGAQVADNAEGSIIPAVPFTAAEIDHYAGEEPTQAAGAALLRLAWQHRRALLLD